jgi:hypothetical protein
MMLYLFIYSVRTPLHPSTALPHSADAAAAAVVYIGNSVKADEITTIRNIFKQKKEKERNVLERK